MDEIPKVVANLKSMLKPGGYLVWIERDSSPRYLKLVTGGVDGAAWTKILNLAHEKTPTVEQWVPKIQDFFEKGCLNDITAFSKVPSLEWIFAWNNSVLGALDDCSPSIENEQKRVRFLDLLSEAYEENLKALNTHGSSR